MLRRFFLNYFWPSIKEETRESQQKEERKEEQDAIACQQMGCKRTMERTRRAGVWRKPEKNGELATYYILLLAKLPTPFQDLRVKK